MVKQIKKMILAATMLLLAAVPLSAQKTYGELSIEQLQNMANNGDIIAQNLLGLRYFNGDKVAKDYSRAVYWWTKAANQGNDRAQFGLGTCYYYGYGVAQDYTQAVYWWTKAANQGFAEAQYGLGDCYYYGRGVTQDYTQAVYWWTRAANQGNDRAQFRLGNCYYYGYGVTQDMAEAKYWFEKYMKNPDSNELGRALAKANMETCERQLSENRNSTKSQKQNSARYTSSNKTTSTNKQSSSADKPTQVVTSGAVVYAEPSEEESALPRKKTAAQTPTAAELFDSGEKCYFGLGGVRRNVAKAIELYTQAADMGHADAQLSLGYCYYLGKGVAKDCQKAVYWLKKAEAGKNELRNARKKLLESTLILAESCQKRAQTSPSTTPTTSTTPTSNATPTATKTYSSAPTPKSTSRDKYAHWPYWYDGISRGFQISYIQRAIYAKESGSGATGHYDIFGNDGWSKGFQFGFHFNPLKKKEIIGMNTGFYMDCLFDRWENAPEEYYDRYFEMALHMPLELALYLPLSKWTSAIHIRAGLGADFSCFGTLMDWDDSTVGNLDAPFGDWFINRFNLTLNLGISFHYDLVMFHITYHKGLLSHPFAEGYRCTLDKLSVGMSFVLDD